MSIQPFVDGKNADAKFVLRAHRGEGMVLLAMDWKGGRPPDDFVGFGITYKEPGGANWLNVTNRLSFGPPPPFPERKPSMDAPIQKFRWVHFPFNADLVGKFTYRVTPRFMKSDETLRSGAAQNVQLELRRETVPGELNVAFTRGFIASQAFVDRWLSGGPINTLLPPNADVALDFVPTHPNAAEALAWMGFEANAEILRVLDLAIADPTANVDVVAFDLANPAVVRRLEALGTRLRIVIDDSKDHKGPERAEGIAEQRLASTAGRSHVVRQHMGSLQHNKTIVVHGPNLNMVLCGSTNFSWRGSYVQNNHVVVLYGAGAVKPFLEAFEGYFRAKGPVAFRSSDSTLWHTIAGSTDVAVTFSPHRPETEVLAEVAADIESATSSVLYSLAFLYQTTGAIRNTITSLTEADEVLVAGISDKAVGGIEVQGPARNRAPVSPAVLGANAPAPFSQEPAGGGGVRMHHKFVVTDFDTPQARVYLGSFNFSGPADKNNGENLLLIRDRKVATAFAVEAIRIIDHYEFRLKQVSEPVEALSLKKAPVGIGDATWFAEHYHDPHRVADRQLFAGTRT